MYFNRSLSLAFKADNRITRSASEQWHIISLLLSCRILYRKRHVVLLFLQNSSPKELNHQWLRRLSPQWIWICTRYSDTDFRDPPNPCLTVGAVILQLATTPGSRDSALIKGLRERSRGKERREESKVMDWAFGWWKCKTPLFTVKEKLDIAACAAVIIHIVRLLWCLFNTNGT